MKSSTINQGTIAQTTNVLFHIFRLTVSDDELLCRIPPFKFNTWLKFCSNYTQKIQYASIHAPLSLPVELCQCKCVERYGCVFMYLNVIEIRIPPYSPILHHTCTFGLYLFWFFFVRTFVINKDKNVMFDWFYNYSSLLMYFPFSWINFLVFYCFIIILLYNVCLHSATHSFVRLYEMSVSVRPRSVSQSIFFVFMKKIRNVYVWKLR